MNIKASLIQKLQQLQQSPQAVKALVGFDGYVDYIQKVVQTAGKTERTYFDTITAYGHHVIAAANKSAQIELRTHAAKMGGNAPIMAHALGSLNISNFCVGTMGIEEVHPVFEHMHPLCNIIPVGPPATSNALEFNDGKIILSEVSVFDTLDLEHILEAAGKDAFVMAMKESRLLAFVDWSNLPFCTSLWNDLLLLAKQEQMKDKIYFFDLCDPSKKSDEEIKEVLKTIAAFSAVGKSVLGLNENEARKVYAVVADKKASQQSPIETIAKELFALLNIDVLMVHPVDCTIAVSKNELAVQKGYVVQQPKVLTGGGDNLNAGFCYGLLHDFTLQEAMIMGMATSGAYVQNGNSPGIGEIINYASEKFE